MQLEISIEALDYLIEHPLNYVNLKFHSERIVQFHRLVLLIHINQERTQEEIAKLYNYGLRMAF